MKQEPTPPPRRLRALAWIARAALWLVLGGWAAFALSWGALHAWIVPRIGEYRPQLESLASRAVGMPVRLGAIAGVSDGAIPGFELQDLRLYDPEGREALHLPRVLVSLSVASLWRLGFEQLVIEAPTLDVRLDTEGRLWVAGVQAGATDEAQGRALRDWFFDQSEFVIRGGTLRWQDERRAAGPLELTQVDFVSRNPGRRHLLRLDATPPPEWGERFSLRADLREPLLSVRDRGWRDWAGELYAQFAHVDLQRLNAHLDSAELLGVALQEGRGALRAWSEVEAGALRSLTVDLALQRASARFAPELPALALSDLAGRLVARWDGRRRELRGEGLALRTDDQRLWTPGRLLLAHETGLRGKPPTAELQADRLDLELLERLAVHLPLTPGQHAQLDELQPRGHITNLQLRAELAPDAPAGSLPARWQAKGRASGLQLRAARVAPPEDGRSHPGRPGLSGGEVDFDASDSGGQARVQLVNGSLSFPGIFDEPDIPFQRLDAELSWRVEGERLELQLPQVRFANADAEGELKASWRTGEGARRLPGVLDLQASLERANGARVFRYLPFDVTREARHYLRDAIRRGSASDTRVRVRGDLHDFPFAGERSGVFSVSARVREVDFDYVPPALRPAGAVPWPGLRGLQGQFRMDRASLSVLDASGGVDGAPGVRLSGVQARVPDYTHDSVLDVKGRASGLAADMLGFVNRSPVAAMTSQALAQASIGGTAELQLGLELPLATLERSKVSGRVTLAGNDVRLRPDTPLLARTSAQVNFSETGFSLAQGQARALGGELRFDGGLRNGGDGRSRLEFQGQGQFTAEGLRQSTELGALAELGRHASGGTGYRLQLAFGSGAVPEVSFSSNLQGLALALPAPLDKAAETSLPLRLESGPRRLALDLGAPLLSARYELDGSDPLRVLRGAIVVGAAPLAAAPEQGVSLQLRLGALDLDAWGEQLDRLGSGLQPGTARAYWPTQVQLQLDQLRLAGRRFHKVAASGTRDDALWRARVSAEEFAGQLEYREPPDNSPGRLFARLEHLTLAATPGGAPADATPAPPQPASVPALDVVVERFVLGQRPLGRLEIQAVNRGTGAGEVREWRLNHIGLTVPEARLSGSGNWTQLGAGSAQRRTALNFRLAVEESGALLERFGMPGTIKGGKGELAGTIGWIGSPLALDVPSLTGQMHLELERGQFLKADPGIAKLLGVLSLQSLPRRLALDFRDVFSDGFAFDFVRGDARIEQGVASTNNLQMKGVNASVAMEGKADIARETQDLSVVVVPDLNTGTAALITAAINPAVGLGSLLAQLLLRQPLQAATTQQFRITGSWADPQVSKVERRAPEPAPAAQTQ